MKIVLAHINGANHNIDKIPYYKDIENISLIEIEWDNINKKPILIQEYSYDFKETRKFLHFYNGLTNTAKLIITFSHIRHRNTMLKEMENNKVKMLHLKGIKLLSIAGLYNDVINKKVITKDDILNHLNITKEKKEIDNLLNIVLLTLFNTNKIQDYMKGLLKL